MAEQKPYVFQEYPKWVKNSEGKPVLVENASEEESVVGKQKSKPVKAVEVEVPNLLTGEQTNTEPVVPEQEKKEEEQVEEPAKRKRKRSKK